MEHFFIHVDLPPSRWVNQGGNMTETNRIKDGDATVLVKAMEIWNTAHHLHKIS